MKTLNSDKLKTTNLLIIVENSRQRKTQDKGKLKILEKPIHVKITKWKMKSNEKNQNNG